MEMWNAAFILASIASSTSAPATTDAAVEDFKQAANLDFNFIKYDLQDLQESYSNSVTKSYLNSVEKLSLSINETYKEEMPKDTAGYNLLCLEGIYDDVVYMMGDLSSAMAMCANMSTSGQRLESNVDQYHVMIDSLEEYSTNLTNLIDRCVVQFPKPSWERLMCVFDRVEDFATQFKPLSNQFKTYNVQMNGHLMLLQVEMTNCFKEALRKSSDISISIKRDLEFCKL